MVLPYVASGASLLFRLFAFLFLRVAPTRVLLWAGGVLYLVHITTAKYLLLPPNAPQKKDDDAGPSADLESRLNTLLFSLPSRHSRRRTLNIVANFAIILFCLEFIITPLFDTAEGVVFSRIGAVYPDSVKIAVRFPAEDVNTTENIVRVLWREQVINQEIVEEIQINENENDNATEVTESKVETTAAELPWKDGPTIVLTADNDWTGIADLRGLWPSTGYEYILADATRSLLSYPSEALRFTTFPDHRLPTGARFRFVASSCTTPNFPYSPLKSRQIKGFKLLADYIRRVPTEFMIFLGDFIYADVPIYGGDNKDYYRSLYRRNYNSEDFRSVYEHLPIMHTYDDHEILNNFAGEGNETKSPFASAVDPFYLYNALPNPDPVKAGEYYYTFRYADSAFFVMDTRRYRHDIDAVEADERSMLGETQLAALYDWLAETNQTATFKFVVSSVPFTKLWTYEGQIDTWAAYPTEKQQILEAFQSVPNVVVISGDRHEFADIRFNGGKHTVREISTSPLSMFYVPFIRTLRPRSLEAVNITTNESVEVPSAVEGAEPEIKTTEKKEEVPVEQVLKYIATGNYKWSSFDVDTTDRSKPVLRLEVLFDGSVGYEVEIEGTPVKLSFSTALGVFNVPAGIRDVFNKMGMTSRRWF